MTTQQYIKELENNVKKLEIRAFMEDDPSKKETLQKRIAARSKLLKTVRKVWGKEGSVEYATLDHSRKEDDENDPNYKN